MNLITAEKNNFEKYIFRFLEISAVIGMSGLAKLCPVKT